MKVFISGYAGFVGRHFARRLLDDGHDVTGTDNMSAGIYPADWAFKPKRPVHQWKFYSRDIRDWVCEYEPDFDLIIHCAAVVGGRLKIDGDPLAVATDLAIDADLFNWVAKHKFKGKLVYFSSSAVYPVELQTETLHLPLHESIVDLSANRIAMPDQIYGWAKLTGELLARHAVEKYGLNVVIYRPFSGYGEDQSLDYPFPSIMQRVARRDERIKVWGSGLQVRDFMHVDDIVDGVLETSKTLAPGDVLNLGTGVGESFNGLVQTAYAVNGRGTYITCMIDNDEDKPQGVFHRVSDPYRMSKLYTPKISLEEGIRRSLDFHRERV